MFSYSQNLDSKFRPRRLRYSERWMRDGLSALLVPSFAVTMDADMTEARTALQIAKSGGLRLTYSHLFVRAAALALAENPEWHQVVGANRIHHPAQVNIALSVGGDTAVAPVMIIKNADAKQLTDIAREVGERTASVREADRALMKALDRWGFLVPLGFLRRALLLALFRNVLARRTDSGTFQVSVLPGVEQASTSVFGTSAVLMAGGVRDKPVVRRGEIAIRPMVTLTCCADHRVWDGRATQGFLASVRDILESDRLLTELRLEPVVSGDVRA
jgi:pyruvate dehydrogenase E2 component (dihydrolipoamide acetyltransferase)